MHISSNQYSTAYCFYGYMAKNSNNKHDLLIFGLTNTLSDLNEVKVRIIDMQDHFSESILKYVRLRKVNTTDLNYTP